MGSVGSNNVAPGRVVALWVAVFSLGTVFYVLCAVRVPFYDKGEPREAQVVRAVVSGEGLILPRVDGGRLPSKPPLFHWLAALAVHAGVRPEELAIRLPSALLGAGGLAFAAVVGARQSGLRAGVLSAAVLGTSFEWLRAATQSRVDMTLAFFLLGTILAWHTVLAGTEKGWAVLLGYLSAAAAVLAKGPVGIVLPVLVVTVGAIACGRAALLHRLVDLPGISVAAAVCGGWYVLAWTDGGGDFASRHLLHENIQRFVGWGGVPHAHSLFYYPPALAGAFFPWTLALPLAARHAWRRWTVLDRLLLIWAATVLVFFSLAAGKRSVYLLPLFPPLAILTGSALAASERNPTSRRTRLGLVAGALVLLGVAAVLGLHGATALGGVLANVLQGSDRVRLSAALAVVHEHRSLIALTVVVIATCLIAATSVRWRGVALVTMALAWGAGLTAFGTYPLALELTPRASAERIAARLGPDDRLCSRGHVDYAFRYYVRRPVQPCRAEARDSPGRTFAVRAVVSRHSGRSRYEMTRLRSWARRRPSGAAPSEHAATRTSESQGGGLP
jgi:4-amino-4-deoxy-L-arabinose transferase-like glycosyltransferase